MKTSETQRWQTNEMNLQFLQVTAGSGVGGGSKWKPVDSLGWGCEAENLRRTRWVYRRVYRTEYWRGESCTEVEFWKSADGFPWVLSSALSIVFVWENLALGKEPLQSMRGNRSQHSQGLRMVPTKQTKNFKFYEDIVEYMKVSWLIGGK